ncbi:hypothetical protein MKX01_040256, partial [Papaver californicum]
MSLDVAADEPFPKKVRHLYQLNSILLKKKHGKRKDFVDVENKVENEAINLINDECDFLEPSKIGVKRPNMKKPKTPSNFFLNFKTSSQITLVDISGVNNLISEG